LTAVVTGGSSGIGEAVALRLALRGCGLVLVSEDAAGLERVRGRILAEAASPPRMAPPSQLAPLRVEVIRLDLTDPKSPQVLFDRCRDLSLRVDILVNCAGIFSNVDDEMDGAGGTGHAGGSEGGAGGGPEGPAAQDRSEALLRLHVNALTRLCLLFGRSMIRRGGGYILNVGSISALFPDPSSLTYGPSKRYVLSFSRLLHLHWREHGVKVTCVVPGAVATDFFRANNITLPAMVRSRLMTADHCARVALRGLFRGRAMVVPGVWSRLHAWLFRLLLRPALYTRLKNLYLSMRR